MSVPNIITVVRIVLSPVFFCVFYIPRLAGSESNIPLLFLWLLLGIIEATDLVDGQLARKLNQISDTGKLLDPFADSLSRLTYFLCFTIAGIMPVWIFLILLYRDLGVSFVRLIMSRRGIAMGARFSGKLKAWIYAIGGIVGLAALTVHTYSTGENLLRIAEITSFVFFLLAAAVALWSLLDYIFVIVPKKV